MVREWSMKSAQNKLKQIGLAAANYESSNGCFAMGFYQSPGLVYVPYITSFHPGGGNAGFADGSVRFLKDSIQTWPLVAATPCYYPGPPGNFGWQGNSTYQYIGQFAVYQALSTRANGEVITSDSY
jgi:prepilin-type processing-associated H-X9-DG protein